MYTGIYSPSGEMNFNSAKLTQFPEVDQCFSSDGRCVPTVLKKNTVWGVRLRHS